MPGNALVPSAGATPSLSDEIRGVLGQLGLRGDAEIAALAEDLRRRDEYDSSRADSPLRPASDAIIVDSTDLDRDAVLDRVVALARHGVRAEEWA